MADLKWNADARTLTGRGYAITFTPLRGKIFDLLWRKFSSGSALDKHQIMDFIYADDPNGGPEGTDCIKQRIFHLKQQIRPFGLSVKGRTGYALVLSLSG